MGRMVRKQLYIDAEHEAALKARAAARGVTEAEIMREALDRYLGDAAQEEAAAAWARFLAFSERQEAKGPGPGKRDWTREELYDRPGKPGRGW